MSVRIPRIPPFLRAISHHNLEARPLHMIFQERRHKTHIAQSNKLTPKAHRAVGIEDSLYRFMITTESPRNTNFQDIISRVPNQKNSAIAALYGWKVLSVVILTTPSFTSWLENDDFMSQLLTTIVGTNPSNINYPKLNVVFAVVDRLPPPEHDGSGKEGFSVLYGRPSFVLPDHHKPSSSPGGQASIMFSFNRIIKKMEKAYCIETRSAGENNERSLPKSIVLPLAKTIFQNGRDSTLIASSWRHMGNDRKYQKIHESDETFERIITLPIGGGLIATHLPVIALTIPRLIVSGMGNIVRQLKGHDEGASIFPASQELEANISDYFERSNLSPAAVSVWAVISEAGASEYDAVPTEPKTLQQGWINRGDNYLNFPVISRTALSIHRVLSGGGGWGIKQGLVSLDPQSEQQFLPSLESGLIVEGSDISEPQELSNIAKPGSLIQFFLAADPSPELVQRKWNPKSQIHRQSPVICDQSLYLGTTPSSIDHISDPSLENSDRSKDDKSFSVYESHFGALSEQGIFIIQEDREYRKIRSTKLDVPCSWIEHYDTHLS